MRYLTALLLTVPLILSACSANQDSSSSVEEKTRFSIDRSAEPSSSSANPVSESAAETEESASEQASLQTSLQNPASAQQTEKKVLSADDFLRHPTYKALVDEPFVLENIDSIRNAHVEEGASFDVENYILQNLQIVDDSKTDQTYTIQFPNGSHVDTSLSGVQTIHFNLVDEEGNERQSFVNVVVGSLELDETSIGAVLYDGEFGTITLDAASSGNDDYFTNTRGDAFRMDITFTNKSSLILEAGFAKAYLDTRRVDVFDEVLNTSPGQSVSYITCIHSTDLGQADWSEYTCQLYLAIPGSSEDNYLLEIPVTVHRSLFGE